jgi:hypothetical protein
MATRLRLRLLCSVSLAAAWLTPLALPSIAGFATRAQDFAAQDPYGQDVQDPPGQDQLPGDDGGTTVRRPRSRAASKKGRGTAQAGADPKAAKEASVASPEKARRYPAAKLSPKERDQKVEAAGRERWKKANPKLKPEVVTGEHFMLFSNLPRDRAGATVKAMEAQYNHLRRLLGAPATDWVEKVSLYVFTDRKDFVAFARGVENRDVDASVWTGSSLNAPQPYVVVVDPLAGKKEEPAAARRKARTKKGEEKEKEAPAGSDRTLLGLLTESLGGQRWPPRGRRPGGSARVSGRTWGPRSSRAARTIRSSGTRRMRSTPRAGTRRRPRSSPRAARSILRRPAP